MQTFLLLIILFLVVINFKQADELRDLERKTLEAFKTFGSQACAASGRKSKLDEQEKTQRFVSESERDRQCF